MQCACPVCIVLCVVDTIELSAFESTCAGSMLTSLCDSPFAQVERAGNDCETKDKGRLHVVLLSSSSSSSSLTPLSHSLLPSPHPSSSLPLTPTASGRGVLTLWLCPVDGQGPASSLQERDSPAQLHGQQGMGPVTYPCAQC